MMKILVTGAKGQLGSEIKEISESYSNLSFVFTDVEDLDICNYNLLKEFIVINNIEAIINCAAYTSVDLAEEQTELVEKINVLGVRNLVNAMEFVNGKLIHISTDYVFDGTNHLPYTEKDKESPIGVYGVTKRNGELLVENSIVDGIVIRTSWLYSNFGNNFVKTMLRLGKDRDVLNVIFDQVGTPTFAGDLALACLEILSKEKRIDSKGKIYHFSNEGVASWYDFAIAIMEIGNIDCLVKPIETKDYPTKAQRPHYSVLNKAKIKSDFGVVVPYWRDSLKKSINKF